MKKILCIVSFLVMGFLPLRAADFSALAPSGQTLYFKYNGNGTVSVVYPKDTNIAMQGWVGFTRPTGALTIPSVVTYGDSVFAVTAIGNHAFRNCTGLTSVTFDEGIVSVGTSAFYSCTGISSIILASTIDTLKASAFADCSALAEVTARRSTPPVTASTVFNNITLANATLNVPCNCAAAYAAAAPWSSFGTISDDNCQVTVSASVNYPQRGSVSGSGTYSMGTVVTLSAMPADGFFFACWHDGDTTNPRLVTASDNLQFTAMLFAMQHDTVNAGLHDTIFIFDSIYLTSPDTVFLHDTISLIPTYYRLTVASGQTELGIGAGSALLPAGTEVEIAAVAFEGCRFSQWNDGNTDNPRQVTVTGNLSYTALFTTSTNGIDPVDTYWNVFTNGNLVSIDCAPGHTLRIYDTAGRQLHTATTVSDTTRIQLRAGAYIVQLDDGPGRKISVTP